MVHAMEEGHSIIDAQTKSGKVLQVGSQYRSSLVYQKATRAVSKRMPLAS